MAARTEDEMDKNNSIDKVNGVQDAEFRTAWTAAPRLDVFGVGVTVLLTAVQTGGAYSTFYIECPPGLGSPPHVHRFDDESFTVLDGTFEFRCGDKTFRAEAGECVFLPRDVPHQFTCVGETAGHLIGIGSPAGHEGFFEAAGKMAHRETPPSMEEMVAVCARFGIDLLP